MRSRVRSRARAAWAITALAFRADRRAAIAATVLGLAQGALTMAYTVLFARIVQEVLTGDADGAMRAVVALVVVNAAIYGVGMLELDLRFRLTELVSGLLDSELIAAMTDAVSLELHERPVHHDRVEVLRKQIGTVSNVVGALIHNVSMWSSLVSTTALLLTVHPILALLPLLGVPAIVAAGTAQRAWDDVIDRSSERLRRSAHLFDVASTAGPGKELRTFGLGDELVRRHDALLRSAYDEITGTQLRWGALAGAAWALFGIGQLFAIAFVTLRAIDGAASVTDVVLTVTVVAMVFQHLVSLNDMVSWLLRSLRAAERYVEVIDAAAAMTVPGPWEPAPAPARLQRGIELDGVTFAYPDSESPVLRDVHLVIPAGATIALVGENGAGKSTLIKLLGRYYAPTSGTITVDGVDLQRIDPVAWRARLSGAFQDHARFELIAREVVGIGDLDRVDDDDAVTAALARAGGAELPARLEQGLATPLGKSFADGIEPSGGQWQQLALGRALLREQPLLLLLDEPTSALDPEAEHTLFEGYAAAARDVAAATGAITILVSHRFSTVRMADLIVVMEDGTVSQTGTHTELLAAGGTYAELYRLQARAYS